MKKLDLHGIPHVDVTNACHEFINQHWNTDQELHIITGHSPAMKELVREVLGIYDVEYTMGDLHNPGYVRLWV